MLKKTVISFVFLALTVLATTTARAGNDMTVIRDAEIEYALKTYATPIFREAGVSPESVRIILLQDDRLNAFVAGGQNIFMNTGLLIKSENASEVAGVIAHETGHIALGHLFRLHEAMEDYTLQSMLASALGIAVAIGAGRGDAGMAAAAAGQNMAMRQVLSHTRTQESSADEAGVRFLKGAHYPLTGFLTFMEKLAGQELLPSTRQDPYVRTHPLTQDRISFLSHAVEQTPPRTLPPAWEELHARMRFKLQGYINPDYMLATRGDSFAIRYGRVIALYRKGRIQDALEDVEPLLQIEPENPWLYELKAQILFESGKITQSLPAYERAIALMPATEAPLIRTAYGHALLEAGGEHLPRALETLHKALAADYAQARPHRLLALAYGKMGEEGLSRLHLAEQYALQNRPALARREALLALQNLPKEGPAPLRAQDILDQTERLEEEKDK